MGAAGARLSRQAAVRSHLEQRRRGGEGKGAAHSSCRPGLPGAHPLQIPFSAGPTDKDLPIACPAGTHIPKQENKEGGGCPVHSPAEQLTHPQRHWPCWQSPSGNTLQGPGILPYCGHRGTSRPQGRCPRTHLGKGLPLASCCSEGRLSRTALVCRSGGPSFSTARQKG